jgi:hypothetical protein
VGKIYDEFHLYNENLPEKYLEFGYDIVAVFIDFGKQWHDSINR